MAPKGVSAAEKRVRMLEIFHETAEFYTLKELEKIAPKTKGIVVQTVKDVLQDLVDDNLVVSDKIGTSNYFWSFPSAAGAVKRGALDKAKNELNALDRRIEDGRAALAAAKKGREDTPERRRLLADLDGIRANGEALKAELAAFSAADPAMYERKKRAAEVAKEAAQRWTDNMTMLMQYAGGLGGPTPYEIRQSMGLAEDWDELK